MNQLDNLKKFSIIVVDSGDINAIKKYNPQNVTTNPSLILKATSLANYTTLFEDALIYARKKGGNQKNRIDNASDKLAVNIGCKILENIPGHISTEIDARLSFNQEKIIQKAHKLIRMYQDQGIQKSRVLIKIAATWEGIKAAEELEKNTIKCNLTLIFSFTQARACADANVYLISPFVGRIYDWYNQQNLLTSHQNINEDPGVQSVKKIFYYYKKHRYNTAVMGASFRTIKQILALSGCDYLTISPKLLNILSSNIKSIERHLFPDENKIIDKPNPLSKSNFLEEHNTNKMAVEKLQEGIQQFSQDQQHLEKILIKAL